jgi:hypothetical protein
MPGPSRLAAAVLLIAAFLVAFPEAARAQTGRPQTIHVLAIDSDDADEQADALTGSLRAHLRQTPGWTLLDTTQSLSMLTAAFRCPQKPDAACLVRIGDKLQANQFLWGVMNKSPGRQVTVELHLWQRGKPDEVARETFSDNVKESNDDALGRIAISLLTKLIGAGGGILALHANADNATVFVDGQQVATLDHGRANIPLAPGPHTVDIQAPGFAKTRKDVTMTSGTSVQLEVQMEADTTATAGGSGKPFPIRPVVGWSLIGLGGVAGIIGVVEGVIFLNDNSDLNSVKNPPVNAGDRMNNYGIQNPQVKNPCTQSQTGLSAFQISNLNAGCSDNSAAVSARNAFIVSYSVGGALVIVGAVVLLTGHKDSSDPPPQTGIRNLRFFPSIGAGNGSMTVVGEF